ncbi:MAG: thiamine diphosphokinase [Treponema sp.]|jgi:thiamine pyrophosphokinase|nr:thiamine diphosphokinase [Treponema sp.]
MRGIVFTGGEGPSSEICRCLAGESHPSAIPATNNGKTIIAAADSGLIAVENAGLTADWITGDMDSLDDQKRLEKYPADRIVRSPVDKDFTDTELAFSVLREKGCDEIWLVGGGGGRIDHLFAIRSLFEREIFPCRWITAREDIYCIEGPGELNAGKSAGKSLVSVFPLGNGPWKATSRGLKWPLDNLVWDRGFFGVSNVAVDGPFSIKAEQGRFMVITPLEE